MSDTNHTNPTGIKWLNGTPLSTWLLQKGAYVAILAGVFWLQLHFVSKGDFDKKKEEDLRAQLELNKVLHDVDMHLQQYDDNHKHDAATDIDHEARIRSLEGRR